LQQAVVTHRVPAPVPPRGQTARGKMKESTMFRKLITPVLGLSLTLLAGAGCMSDDDKGMKADKMIMDGREMREKGRVANDKEMMEKGQMKMDKGMKMKSDVVNTRKM
jgi:hypothetical protein